MNRGIELACPGPIDLVDVETGQSLTSQADPAAVSAACMAHDERVRRLSASRH